MQKEDPIARAERIQANKKNNVPVVILAVVAAILAIVLAVVATKDYKMVKELEQDKADLQERITALKTDFDNLTSDYDEINKQLDSSREEVALLVDRIKRTEATNRQKMRAYEKELGTLRSIMKSYVVQIDSLNSVNLRLSTELSNSRQELAEAKGQNQELTSKVNDLASKVATGSIVKARGIAVEAYNASEKKTDRSYYEDFETRDYPKGKFDETCMDAVPLSFYLLSQASSFEDAIRLAISHGGDSDTSGAIVGSIAEARFGIPQEIKNRAMEYLPDEMQDVLKQFAGKCEIKPK